MSRLASLIALVVALTVALATGAFGALPHPDTTYRGATSDEGRIRIVAATKHLLSSVKVTDSCGETTVFKHVKVRDDGSFKKGIKNDFGQVSWRVRGSFTHRSTAKGVFSEVVCTGADATFTARSQ